MYIFSDNFITNCLYINNLQIQRTTLRPVHLSTFVQNSGDPCTENSWKFHTRVHTCMITTAKNRTAARAVTPSCTHLLNFATWMFSFGDEAMYKTLSTYIFSVFCTFFHFFCSIFLLCTYRANYNVVERLTSDSRAKKAKTKIQDAGS